MLAPGATKRRGVGDCSYSLVTPVSSIGPLMGKSSDSKILKKTKLCVVSSGLVLQVAFIGFRPFFGGRAQVKKSWGLAYHMSFKGTS